MIVLVVWNILLIGVLVCAISGENNLICFALALICTFVIEILCWFLGYTNALDEREEFDGWH